MNQSRKSPFPGMDPYLEDFWPEVHARLIVYSANQINSQLPDELQAHIERNLTVQNEDEGEARAIRPDITVAGDPIPHEEPADGSSVVVAEPIIVESPFARRNVEIRGRDGRVITAIELVSPWNKLGEKGRSAYFRKQMDYLHAGVSLVEIDLTRQGKSIVVSSLSDPSERLTQVNTTYDICINRFAGEEFLEIYEAPLTELLPNIPIPLRMTDSDAVLQLQPLIDACYTDGRYYRMKYDSKPRGSFAESDIDFISTTVAK